MFILCCAFSSVFVHVEPAFFICCAIFLPYQFHCIKLVEFFNVFFHNHIVSLTLCLQQCSHTGCCWTPLTSLQLFLLVLTFVLQQRSINFFVCMFLLYYGGLDLYDQTWCYFLVQ